MKWLQLGEQTTATMKMLGVYVLVGLGQTAGVGGLQPPYDYAPFLPDSCDISDTHTNGMAIGILTSGGYDRTRNPAVYLGTAVQVRMNIFINQIYDFDERGQHYKVVGYLRQSWVDPRLAWNESAAWRSDVNGTCWPDSLTVPPEMVSIP